MKKCPYCFELVQEEAIKCKHCNEWLNKENNFKKIINNVSNKLDAIKEDKERKKTEHLYIPTYENPLIVNHIKLFPNKITIEDEEIDFSEILQIKYSAEVTTRNFITNRYLVFSLKILKENSNNKLVEKTLNLATKDNEFDFIQSTHNKINFEKYQLIHNIISKNSFLNRLNNYIRKISIDGGYIYNNFIFKVNGDVFRVNKQEKIICNIYEAKRLNRIEWGVKWSGMNSSNINPNEFRVLNGGTELKLLFGIIQTGVYLRISPNENIDIFNYIIKFLLENEKFPEIINNI